MQFRLKIFKKNHCRFHLEIDIECKNIPSRSIEKSYSYNLTRNVEKEGDDGLSRSIGTVSSSIWDQGVIGEVCREFVPSGRLHVSKEGVVRRESLRRGEQRSEAEMGLRCQESFLGSS